MKKHNKFDPIQAKFEFYSTFINAIGKRIDKLEKRIDRFEKT